VDRFIAGFPAEQDGDLMLCHAQGVAYQRDRTHIVNYDGQYFDKCASYEGQEIAEKINAGRICLVQKHFGGGLVLDTGIGSGEFIKKRLNTYGRDVNPVAIEWLKRNDLWALYPSEFDAFTFWDVIEHLENPELLFRDIVRGAYLFTCLPVFDDLHKIRQSKHYRPGEHLYYWTDKGFVEWMALHSFHLLERQHFETEAGRDGVVSYAFKHHG
jgi:hypothetical protein